MSASNFVHLDVEEVLAETEKALLLQLKEEYLWVPKSQISDDEEYEVGDKNCTISVSEWFARKRGLI